MITPEVNDTAGQAMVTLAEASRDAGLQQEIKDAFDERWKTAEDPRLLGMYAARLPQLPDREAEAAYERVKEWERHLIIPNHPLDEQPVPFAEVFYGEGTAVSDDDLRRIGSGPVLFEAQHATDPVRKKTGKREAADHGTAGLAATLASEGMGRAIIPLGRQLGNANVNPEHPIKDAMRDELSTGSYQGFISVHGKVPGQAIDLRDRTEVHAVIGLGRNPQDSSLEIAELLRARARDELGLRLEIGNYTPQLAYRKRPNYDDRQFRSHFNLLARHGNGDLKLSKLAADSETSTTTYSQEQFPDVPAVQLELSRSIRLTPHERDHGARVMGVYLGYSLTKLAAELYGSYTR